MSELEAEMLAAAETQDYERAAELRNRVIALKKQMGSELSPTESAAAAATAARREGKGKRGRGKKSGGGRIPKPER